MSSDRPTAAEPMSLTRPICGIDREADAVGKLLDRGVEQLDDQDENHDTDQREPLPGRVGDDEGERNRQDERGQLLAKRLLAARGGDKAVPAIDGGAQQSVHDERLRVGSYDGAAPIYRRRAPNPARLDGRAPRQKSA